MTPASWCSGGSFLKHQKTHYPQRYVSCCSLNRYYSYVVQDDSYIKKALYPFVTLEGKHNAALGGLILIPKNSESYSLIPAVFPSIRLSAPISLFIIKMLPHLRLRDVAGRLHEYRPKSTLGDWRVHRDDEHLIAHEALTAEFDMLRAADNHKAKAIQNCGDIFACENLKPSPHASVEEPRRVLLIGRCDWWKRDSG
jgi:hypothetical protein